MRAAICTKYGPPEVLQIRNVAKPIPKDHEILVKIMASTVNSGDVRVRGLVVHGFMKVIMRFVLGFAKPRRPVLGTVFAGIIEGVGKHVTNFNIRDEVYGSTGFQFGTHAEYLVISETANVITKPHNASFDEAAAIIFGGQSAIYFLHKAHIAEKQHPQILIYGASGAVGSAAIQIAKYYKATITAVCSSRSQKLVKSLGADKVILYDKEDFTHLTTKFDIIFDAVGKTSKKQCLPLLRSDGIYKTVEGFEVATETRAQLELLRKLYERREYQAVIDRVYPFSQLVAAHRYVESGRKQGNVVLQMGKH